MKKTLSLIVLLCAVMAQSQIVNIPNANFKAALIEQDVDTNDDGEIQVAEAQATVNLAFPAGNFTDVIGIEAFTNLINLSFETGILTSLNISNMPNLAILECNHNQITSLTLSNLPMLNTLMCHHNTLTELDISGLPSLSHIECDHNPGMTTLNLKNGVVEDSFSFIFDGNPSLTYICADENQVSSLQAIASVAAPLAVISSYCTFVPGGNYNTITGQVIFDGDNNGCTAEDVMSPLVKINITDGTQNGATFSLADFSYAFYTGAGSFTVAPDIENPLFFNVMPADALVDFPVVDNSVATRNFCLSTNGVHPDLEIVVAPIVPARPGFDAVYEVVYRNKGNQAISQTDGLSFSYNQNLMNFVSTSQMTSTQAPGTITWDFANLTPFESRSIQLVMHINAPTDANPVNVGDVLNLTGVVLPQAGDENVPDNTFVFHQTVIGSYDPNNLICIEGDVVSPAEIGNYLHYIANFENTGTDVAENVVVKMTIDETQFDVNSLRILDGSHPVNAKISGNVAEFIFQNINLEIGGHGNILLKIKTGSDLVAGDVVSNKADIYFDYNLPVATNDAFTAFEVLNVPGNEQDQSISIFPNPAQSIVNIQAASEIKSIALYDIQGRLLQVSQRDGVSVSIDISDRQKGIYFLKITSEKGISVQKIIKE